MAEQTVAALDQAGREVMSRQYDPATWALALAGAEGNEDAARAAYIKLRVPILMDAFAAAERKLEAERIHQRMRDEAAKRNAVAELRRSEREKAEKQANAQIVCREAGRRFKRLLHSFGF